MFPMAHSVCGVRCAVCGVRFLAQDYLSDAEFLAVVGMNRAEYANCKKWKQTSIKKKAGIY